MTAEDLEYLDMRYPIEVNVRQDPPDFLRFSRVHLEKPLKYELIFSVPADLSTVEGVAMMYYQFDKFMKERYGDHIKEYQDAVRSKRIDLTQTEPGTDTGDK